MVSSQEVLEEVSVAEVQVADLAVSVVAEVLAEVALLEVGRILKFNKNNHEKLNVHF